MAKYIVELEVDEETCEIKAIKGGYKNPTKQQAIKAELSLCLHSGISVISVKKKEE